MTKSLFVSLLASMVLLSGCTFVWQLDKSVLSVDDKGNECDLTKNSEFNYAVALISEREKNKKTLRWKYAGENDCEYAAGWSIINTIMNAGTISCRPMQDKGNLQKYDTELKNAQQLCHKYAVGYGAGSSVADSYMHKRIQEEVSQASDVRYRDFITEYQFLGPSKIYQMIASHIAKNEMMPLFDQKGEMCLRIAALRLENRNDEAEKFSNYYKSRFGDTCNNDTKLKQYVSVMRFNSQGIDVGKFASLNKQFKIWLNKLVSDKADDKMKKLLTDIFSAVDGLYYLDSLQEEEIGNIFKEIDKLPANTYDANIKEILRNFVRYEGLEFLGELILSEEDGSIDYLSMNEELLKLERWWDAQAPDKSVPLDVVSGLTDAYKRLTGIVQEAAACQQKDEQRRQTIDDLNNKIRELRDKRSRLEEQAEARNVALGKINAKQRRALLSDIDKISANVKRLEEKIGEVEFELSQCGFFQRWAVMRDLNNGDALNERISWLTGRRAAWLEIEAEMNLKNLTEDKVCENLFTSMLNTHVWNTDVFASCLMLIQHLSKYLSTGNTGIINSHEQNMIFFTKTIEIYGVRDLKRSALYQKYYIENINAIEVFFDRQKSMEHASAEARKRAHIIAQKINPQSNKKQMKKENSERGTQQANAGGAATQKKADAPTVDKQKQLRWMLEAEDAIKKKYKCGSLVMKDMRPEGSGYRFYFNCKLGDNDRQVSCYNSDREMRCD